MVFEIKTSFHNKKGQDSHLPLVLPFLFWRKGRREEEEWKGEERSVALLLVRIRQSCKFMSQIQAISGKIAWAVLQMPKPPSPYIEIPCEKTLVSG